MKIIAAPPGQLLYRQTESGDFVPSEPVIAWAIARRPTPWTPTGPVLGASWVVAFGLDDEAGLTGPGVYALPAGERYALDEQGRLAPSERFGLKVHSRSHDNMSIETREAEANAEFAAHIAVNALRHALDEGRLPAAEPGKPVLTAGAFAFSANDEADWSITQDGDLIADVLGSCFVDLEDGFEPGPRWAETFLGEFYAALDAATRQHGFEPGPRWAETFLGEFYAALDAATRQHGAG